LAIGLTFLSKSFLWEYLAKKVSYMISDMSRHQELQKINGTNLEITRLGLGTAPLGGLFTSITEEAADGVVAAAFGQGINYFDTAPLYGHGRAEIRLGRALRAAGKPFVISTKVGRVLNPTENADTSWFADASPTLDPVYDWSPEGIKRSIHESLARLGVDHIDIALMHDAQDYVDVAIHSAYPVLADLRDQGVIKAVGMGMDFCKPAIKIMSETDLNIALIAGRYTLLDQEAQDVLFPLALKKNVSIVIGGVYNSGVLANPNPGTTYDYLPASDEIINRARKIGAFLKERNIPLTAAAIQFPLRHKAVTSVLTGSRSSDELKANVADFNFEIPQSVWEDFETSGLVAPLKN
jgi:D-threo-aldose 1-dehydrogenase